MKKFTIVLPVRDTDKEYEFLNKSLPSAIELGPSEILIGVDSPLAQRIKDRADVIAKSKKFTNLKIIPVARDPLWNFQLAKVVYVCYQEATNDFILSFDVDSILNRNVLLGLEQIGEGNVAVVSFTKKLLINSISDLIRYIFYRIRVFQSDYVFSGVYWIYRPYYFEVISKERIQRIYNGVDTILTESLLKQNKFKIITRKEIGVKCLTKQNEDLDWRQFQSGIWVYAKNKNLFDARKKRQSQIWLDFEKRKSNSYSKADGMISLYARKCRLSLSFLKLKFMINRPSFFLFTKVFAYQHWALLKGFYWAKNNSDSKSVKIAQSLDFNEWCYSGSQYLPNLKWKDKGTGFIEN